MVRGISIDRRRTANRGGNRALLDSLVRQDRSAETKAKSLFSLAAAANQSRRSGDAIRVNRLGLTFAPANSDALLALGDLYRDRNDYDGARRLYELLQRNGGSAADSGRERLAALPRQQETPANNRLRPMLRTMPRRPLRLAPYHSQTATRSEPRRPLDGTYVGSGQANGSSSPNCVLGRSAWKSGTASFHSEGADRRLWSGDATFSGTNTIGRPPVVQFWDGKSSGTILKPGQRSCLHVSYFSEDGLP